MEYRSLGTSGLQVSEIGLGTNNFGSRIDEATCRAIVDECLELGVNFIDTADVYGQGQSETVLGRVFAGRRDSVVLATKFGMPMGDGSRYRRGASRRWIVQAVEDSLRRLNTDYIDLYQVHTPDAGTPIVETLQALDDLVRQGKVRYIGHSNFAAYQAVDADWTARTEHLARPISSQLYFNLLNREIEAEAMPAAWEFGLGVIPFFPLESGFLTGKYKRDSTPDGARLAEGPRRDSVLTEENFERLQRLEAFATERDHTLLELALGWLLSHDEVSSVIAGASGAAQVRQNVEAASWRLDASEMEAVGKL